MIQCFSITKVKYSFKTKYKLFFIRKKLYEAKRIEQVDINGSSMWLHKGNVKATDEARLSYLQDRNLFGDKVGKCPHCNEKYKTVDHLATQCDRMLYHDKT